ncbi:MAG: DUF4956 domain-containing protein [Candidatus Cryptobacteroides sp.]
MIQDFPEFDPSIADEFGYAVTNGTTFLGVPLLEATNLYHLLMRFAFNLLVSWIITYFIYRKKNGRNEYCVTFLAFASAMFLLIFLMESVKLQIGLTLGLFAIFGVIRYRTETVPVREMTYLFVIITVAVINGLALNISYAELVIANILIISLLLVIEYSIGRTRKGRLTTKIVLYDKIENIVPERREELIADIAKRIGVNVEAIEIGHVDFLRDAAWLKVSYYLGKGESDTINNIVREKDFNNE